METNNIRDRIRDLIKKIKEEKEAKMAFLYSIVYFVFITVLLVFGTTGRAQTLSHEGSAIKTSEWKPVMAQEGAPSYTMPIEGVRNP